MISFVSLYFYHVVANTTFIPLAIWVRATHITMGSYIWEVIVPTLIGNIIGGAIFYSMSGLWVHPLNVKTESDIRNLLLVLAPS
jgi:formate/nitrite transporter FocA (FNT family)